MRPKRLAELLKKCEKDSKESIDLVVVGHLTHFNYIPFAFVGVDNSSEAHLVTGRQRAKGHNMIVFSSVQYGPGTGPNYRRHCHNPKLNNEINED